MNHKDLREIILFSLKKISILQTVAANYELDGDNMAQLTVSDKLGNTFAITVRQDFNS